MGLEFDLVDLVPVLSCFLTYFVKELVFFDTEKLLKFFLALLRKNSGQFLVTYDWTVF